MDNPYENSKLLGEYLLFHYGLGKDLMPWDTGPRNILNFTRRTVDELVDFENIGENSVALDLGCAVGGSTFHLGKYFSRVLGVDYSNSFINAAKHLKKNGSLKFCFQEEGNDFRESMAVVKQGPGEVEFMTADACNLPDDLGTFDLVHAANLICRLKEPKLLLERLAALVKKGGQLILVTPFTWLEEFTPREKWLGSGDSEEKLNDFLSPFFKIEKKQDMPFVIREHRRKFQFSVSLGMRWRRL